MVFNIKYTETNVGWFEVEANSKEEAIRKFWILAGNGTYDLSQTDIMDCGAIAYEQNCCRQTKLL